MKLRAWMKKERVSAAMFAERIGVKARAVDHWRNGDRVPRPAQMARIVKATKGDVTPNDFYGRDQ